MRKALEGDPPLPEGWENLPEEYRIAYYDEFLVYCYYDLTYGCHSWNDLPCAVEYYTIGVIFLEKWYKSNRLHRDGDKPSRICYKQDGTILDSAYWLNGYEYTLDGFKKNLRVLREIL